MGTQENLREVRERISRATEKAGRDPSEIRIVAACKYATIEQIEEAIRAGITALGENTVQQAKIHYAALAEKYPQLTWHMIGHLQRNKVGQALDIFAIIHSVDSERLAVELDQQAQETCRPAGKAEKTIPILIEVNTSGEESKSGVSVTKVVELVKFAAGCSNLSVQGLMTMAPIVANPENARPYFRKLKALSQELKMIPKVEMKYLSMGMSDDFEVAIQEGANILRLGRAIFKPA